MATTALVPSARNMSTIPSRLRQHVERIRGLMSDMANNSLALGRELTSAKEYFDSLGEKSRPAPTWAKWVATEFGFSKDWSNKLMRISKSATKSNKHLAADVISIITATPSSEAQVKAVAEINQRISGDGMISSRAARIILRKHKHGNAGAKMPSPTEAREIAARHHIIVAASDGRLYTGASEEAVKEATDKRTLVYGVRRALETLASVPMTAKEFLRYADPHQLWTKDEERVIFEALIFVKNLNDCWEGTPNVTVRQAH